MVVVFLGNRNKLKHQLNQPPKYPNRFIKSNNALVC